MNKKHYAERDPATLEPHFMNHMMAMTGENLHSKGAIAAELAHRDIEIERLMETLTASITALAQEKVKVGLFQVDIDSLQKQVDDMTRAPLSDDEIAELWQLRMRVGNRGFIPFARAIEKAHGIVDEPDITKEEMQECSTCDGFASAHRVGCPLGEELSQRDLDELAEFGIDTPTIGDHDAVQHAAKQGVTVKYEK